MADYVQYRPGVGIRYPSSGELVGRVADYLRLKGYLKDDWTGGSYKTAQRYFQGKRIEPELAEQILDTLVDALLPDALIPRGLVPHGLSPRRWARSYLGQALRQWDVLAGIMNGRAFPIFESKYTPMPLLRLLTLDLAIRWGAVQALRSRASGEPDYDPSWLRAGALRRTMDDVRRSVQGDQPRLSLEVLAERIDVSMNTLESWRRGDSFPTDTNLQAMVAALKEVVGGERSELEFALRLAVGADAFRCQLIELSGEDDFERYAADFREVAALVSRWLQFAPLPDGCWPDGILHLVEHGARSLPLGAAVCAFLVESCPINEELQADLVVLPGQWDGRLQYWARWIDDMRRMKEEVARRIDETSTKPKTPKRKRSKNRHNQSDIPHRSQFSERPSDFPYSVVITPRDPKAKASLRVMQADRAASIEDFETAVEHMRHAVRHDPASSYHHYALGAYLGELVERGHFDLLDEAIEECQQAARIDPNWNSPPTEIGIILSNAGRIEEAEEAFARAEPVAREWDHFHQTRGVNLLWLGRFADAAASLNRALELQPADLNTRMYLAAALAWIGDEKALETQAREIRFQGGPRFTNAEDWKRCIPRLPNPIQPRRAEAGQSPKTDPPSPVAQVPSGSRRRSDRLGRNDPCPCGSGKKYKRCCGLSV